jgi:tetratricopeptide (TPR) repeat protein
VTVTSDPDRLLELAREVHWTFPSSAGNPVRRADRDERVERLVAEQDTLAEVANRLIEDGRTDAALELAAGAWRVWMLSRDLAAGRAFLAVVLERDHAEPSRELALALYGDGLFAFWQGALGDSRHRNEAALDAARAVGDPEALALAHLGLSRVAFSDGDFERARSLGADARDHARPLSRALSQAPTHAHAQGTRMLGDYDEAAKLFEESLALNRELDDPSMIAVELHNLGHVELHRGNVDAAARYFAEFAELGSADDPYGVALEQLNEAALAFARGDRDEPRRLVARIDAIVADSGTELAPDDRFEVEWLRSRLAEE